MLAHLLPSRHRRSDCITATPAATSAEAGASSGFPGPEQRATHWFRDGGEKNNLWLERKKRNFFLTLPSALTGVAVMSSGRVLAELGGSQAEHPPWEGGDEGPLRAAELGCTAWGLPQKYKIKVTMFGRSESSRGGGMQNQSWWEQMPIWKLQSCAAWKATFITAADVE